jgi:hypothetical protein
MPAPEPSQSAQPGASAPGLPPAPPSESPALRDRQPGHITVVHPTGFTPYAAEGVDLKQPLFARVTYRPH